VTEHARPLLPDKEFFNIGEACRILQIPAHRLRYWETRFPTLRPHRLEGGHRRYRRADMEMLFHIKELIDSRKLTAAGARRQLARNRKGGRLPAGDGGAGLPPAAAKLLRQVRDDIRRIVLDLSQ